MLALVVAEVSPPLKAQSAPASASAAVTVLKAARMFDGRSDTTVANAVVIVEGGKIREVGSSLAIPPGSTVIDLGLRL